MTTHDLGEQQVASRAVGASYARGSYTKPDTIYEIEKRYSPRTLFTSGSSGVSSPEKLPPSHVEKDPGATTAALPLHFVPADAPRKVIDADEHLEFEGTIPADLKAYLFEHAVHVEKIVLKFPLAYVYVRVLDIAFHKHVFVRHTCDSWETNTDTDAQYVEAPTESPDTMGSTRQFCAVLRLAAPVNCLEFAVCYQVDGKEYWDNCEGTNYRIRVASRPSSPVRRASSIRITDV
eukprot:m.90123 g.90123  ORF g.90123 m.90123 type:complete len:234 (-) comp8445_c0_seq2:99-800(-)